MTNVLIESSLEKSASDPMDLLCRCAVADIDFVWADAYKGA